ncbi:MAG: hypothetical protein IIC92_11050 [Chloroflexi bacterium]|nr:hypothetical protein [Chloroflexota bacterium]
MAGAASLRQRASRQCGDDRRSWLPAAARSYNWRNMLACGHVIGSAARQQVKGDMSSVNLNQIEAIFLDDGSVMSDNERRAPQFRRILGDYVSLRLGGEPSAWSDANAAILASNMAALDAPSDDDECAEFAKTTARYVWARVRCDP